MTPERETAVAERLAQIRERCAKTTPGPWTYDDRSEEVRGRDGNVVLDCERDSQRDSDGEFAAHAREDIPWLLKQVELVRDLASQFRIMHGDAAAKLAEAQKDSARLDWLNVASEEELADLLGATVCDEDPNVWRTAIDAAMEKKP